MEIKEIISSVEKKVFLLKTLYFEEFFDCLVAFARNKDNLEEILSGLANFKQKIVIKKIVGEFLVKNREKISKKCFCTSLLEASNRNLMGINEILLDRNVNNLSNSLEKLKEMLIFEEKMTKKVENFKEKGDFKERTVNYKEVFLKKNEEKDKKKKVLLSDLLPRKEILNNFLAKRTFEREELENKYLARDFSQSELKNKRNTNNLFSFYNKKKSTSLNSLLREGSCNSPNKKNLSGNKVFRKRKKSVETGEKIRRFYQDINNNDIMLKNNPPLSELIKQPLPLPSLPFLRRSKHDGNSFYRTFGFAYFEVLILENRQPQIKNLKQYAKSCDFNLCKNNYLLSTFDLQIYKNEIIKLVNLIENCQKTKDSVNLIYDELVKDVKKDQALVLFFRWLALESFDYLNKNREYVVVEQILSEYEDQKESISLFGSEPNEGVLIFITNFLKCEVNVYNFDKGELESEIHAPVITDVKNPVKIQLFKSAENYDLCYSKGFIDKFY